MPNKAIHQLEEVTRLKDDDLFIIARPSGGAYIDRSINAATFPQRVELAAVTVPTASVLTLGTTPYTLIPAPGAGKAIVPKQVLMSMISGTTGYATQTDVYVACDGGSDIFRLEIDNAGNTPQIATAELAGTVVDNADLELNAASVNPTAGDYDLVLQIWYQIVDL
jgi:hypothetical protein